VKSVNKEEEAILSKDAKTNMSKNLDDTDKRILQLLQDDFPLVERPWSQISSKLGITEDELVTRLKRLSTAGVIRKIGPIVDSSKVGLTAATLVAIRVPENKVEYVSQVINQYGNISHNYEREHEYNIWFTLVASTPQELQTTLNEIMQKAGLNHTDILNLPTAQRFKINVNFQLTPQF
jgi:DNA-binding Lrp family transcriptional regulator